MSTPFSFSGALNLPGGPGLPNDPIPLSLSSSFDSKIVARLVLIGTGSQVVPMGTLASPGVKGLLLTVEASTSAAPVNVTINSSSAPIEVSPGGFLALGSPAPSSGVTAITVAHTTPVNVNIWALG